MINITNRQKREFRNSYRHLDLRFRPDGTVEARNGAHGAYQVMLTPEQTAQKVASIGQKSKHTR